MVHRPWLCGTLYGLLLYAVMNFVVVALSAAEVGGAKDTAPFLFAWLPHIALMGWPIAWLARIRALGPLRAHYQQLHARGKLGKVALVACMRKLLTIVNARRRDELRKGSGRVITA